MQSKLLTRLFNQAWAFNRPLTVAGLLHLALIPLFVTAIILDPQVITGAPAWIKPLKFAISGAIYCLTFLWLLTYVQGRRRWVQVAATLTGLALIVETGLIAMQVVRGTTSHYNTATAFDAAVFNIMGIFIVAVAVFNLLAGLWLLLQTLPDPAFGWSLRLAVLVTFVGMMTGVLMTSNMTPSQTAGAHSVGVADGGPGLPFVGWSTEGGDLRVGHFLGLHALQVLPVTAWLLSRGSLRRRLDTRSRTRLVIIAGVGYLGLTLLLIWQALRGQSLVAPDALTLMVAGGWLALVMGAAAWAWPWRAARVQPASPQPN